MLPLPSPAPTTAERIRSACARAGGALLALENGEASGKADAVATPVHHLLHDGSFAVAIPADHEGMAGSTISGSQALLELIDYAPLPLREPVRSLVWVRGRLQQVPPETVTQMLDVIAGEHPDPAFSHYRTSASPQSSWPKWRVTVTDCNGST